MLQATCCQLLPWCKADFRFVQATEENNTKMCRQAAKENFNLFFTLENLENFSTFSKFPKVKNKFKKGIKFKNFKKLKIGNFISSYENSKL
jgi:hypothetical protein